MEKVMNVIKIIKSVIVVLILWGVTGCNDSDSSQKESVILEDTRWELRTYGPKDDLQTMVNETFVTAFFDKTNASVSGSGGCNHYGGEYTVEQNKLSISALFYTEMYCQEPEGVMPQEQQFLSLLSDARNYQFSEGYLQIVCADEQLLLFKEIIEIEVGMEDNGTQVMLKGDDFLLVSLSSNASTGYQWEVAEVNASVLQQMGESEYVSPELTNPPMVGASGIDKFRFRAMNSGTTSLKLVYKRPWETSADKTYLLKVLVGE